MMMQAREMLVQGYALDALFRHEKLTLTEDDLDAAARQHEPAGSQGRPSRNGGERPGIRAARGG